MTPRSGGKGGLRAVGTTPKLDVVEVIDFTDNRLAKSLFGEHDRHLVRMEQKLGVVLTPRGNRVSVKGNPDKATRAVAVLKGLYESLKQGQEVLDADVDAAIRMAEGPLDEVASGKAQNQHTIRTTKRMISPRSPAQATYIEALRSSDLTLGLGPAGTGKTYIAVAIAISMMLEGKIDRLILSRPAVEAGERLGFLPGDMRDKVDPYLRPLYDALYDMLPADQVDRKLESGEIEIAPLAFMRGRTLSNAFVILDEAQNTSPMQMKMFLTRLGENSHMAITGDPTQVDLPTGIQSGLADVIGLLDGMKGVSICQFSEKDVVRHGLVTRIVAAYNRRDKSRQSKKQITGQPTGRDDGSA